MAQMLPMIQIVPNMNLALDPVSGVIGASLGEGVILLSDRKSTRLNSSH